MAKGNGQMNSHSFVFFKAALICPSGVWKPRLAQAHSFVEMVDATFHTKQWKRCSIVEPKTWRASHRMALISCSHQMYLWGTPSSPSGGEWKGVKSSYWGAWEGKINLIRRLPGEKINLQGAEKAQLQSVESVESQRMDRVGIWRCKRMDWVGTWLWIDGPSRVENRLKARKLLGEKYWLEVVVWVGVENQLRINWVCWCMITCLSWHYFTLAFMHGSLSRVYCFPWFLLSHLPLFSLHAFQFSVCRTDLDAGSMG